MKTLTYNGTEYLVEKIKNIINPLNRKIIFMGDSYGRGLQPNSQPDIANWVDLTATRMGLSSNDYYNWSVSGAGFLATSDSLNWLKILQSNYSSVQDIAYTITDFVMGGGINDANTMSNGDGRGATPTLISKIETVFDEIRTCFPNAKIWISPFGWCRGQKNRRDIMCNNVFYAYTVACANKGAVYIDSGEYVLHNYGLMASDYYHPNLDGENAIADVVSSALMGCPKALSSYTKNGNNQGYIYANMNFTKTSSATFNQGGEYNFLSYMDGRTCFLYSGLERLDAPSNSYFVCDGTAATLGTVSAGHFAACNWGGPGANEYPSFAIPCTVKKKGVSSYSTGTFYMWFNETSDTPMTGGTITVYWCCKALDPTTTAHEWLTQADCIFDMNMRNLSLPASMC